jgi:geranylgeranyl reductase family protein
MTYDAIVVGAGPSGSTTAYHLAKAGARVLLVDRARFPRDKPCGGGVTSRAYLEAPVNLDPVVEHRIRRVRFSYRLGGFFDYEYPETLVYMTQRRRLDAFLVEQAALAGAEVREGALVREVEAANGSGRVRINGETAEAAILVGADGANGLVARSMGLEPSTDPAVALEAEFVFGEDGCPPEWRDMLALELGSMRGGYGWSFPKSDHFNVGCGGWRSEGSRLRSHLDALTSHYALDPATVSVTKGHHLPTRAPGRQIVRGRTLLVGDAAGLVDPMSGEGLHSAFVSGRIAARAVQLYCEGRAPDLRHYEDAIEREIMTEIRAATELRDAYHFTPLVYVTAMRFNDYLRRSLCQIMLGQKTYEGFLSALGPVRLGLKAGAALGRTARRWRERRPTAH